MKVTKAGLTEILRLNLLYQQGAEGGRRADLSGADLTDADLTGVDLSGDNLTNVNGGHSDDCGT